MDFQGREMGKHVLEGGTSENKSLEVRGHGQGEYCKYSSWGKYWDGSPA